MRQSDADRRYWADRTRELGVNAGGYRDLDMDAYEDRLRWAALDRLLGAGLGRSLLDVGCGNGRHSVRLAKVGWVVTGVDFSQQLMAMAAKAPNVSYIASAIQDLELPSSSFDAWLSVTALQHITASEEFDRALENITRMTRSGGIAGVLEYAPLTTRRSSGSYLHARSRREWVRALTEHGYAKTQETGIRFVGHIPYMLAMRLWRRVGWNVGHLRWLRSVGWAIDLALARIPVVTLAADVRLMTFERIAA